MRNLITTLALLCSLPATAAPDASTYQFALDQHVQAQSKQASAFSAADKAVMARAAQTLAQQMPNPGLKAGERAPDFSLQNAFGETVTLSQALEQGPVVLVFYRGAWCPYCNLHLHVLQKRLPELQQLGAQLITVTPQTPDRSARQIREDGYPFEVLSDLDSSVMKSYKLYYELPAELTAVYKKHGLDIESFNGEGRAVLPIPGSVVIDSDGIIRAVHAETDYRQRMEPDDMIAALKRIKGL